MMNGERSLVFILPEKLPPEASEFSARNSGRVLQLPRDQLLHDFVCSAIDALHPCVCPHLTNGVFLHETIATMQLQAFIQHPCLRVCRPVFAHRCFVWCQFPAQMFCHALIKECSADHRFGFAFRQLEPCVLELHDWSAKGFAFATICDGALNGAFHCANGSQAMINRSWGSWFIS